MEDYLRCGVPQFGFARLRCESCGFELLVPFSCKSRGLCASFHAKMLSHWTERLLSDLLPDVPYRQWVFTVPKRIRPFFKYEPNFNKHFSQIIADLLQQWMQTTLGSTSLRPIMLAVDQSFGTLLNYHPHQHWLISDGAFTLARSFLPMPRMEKKLREQLTKALQKQVIRWLVKHDKLDADEAEHMLNWKHTGFSIDTSVRILPGRRHELEKLLCYIYRHPFRMGGFRYNPETGNVIYHATKMHGTLNQNFVVFSTPLEALEALSQLIPHRRKHVVRYYGAAHPLVREIYGLRPGHHPRIEQLPHPLLRLTQMGTYPLADIRYRCHAMSKMQLSPTTHRHYYRPRRHLTHTPNTQTKYHTPTIDLCSRSPSLFSCLTLTHR
jgi:hypothetical protein